MLIIFRLTQPFHERIYQFYGVLKRPLSKDSLFAVGAKNFPCTNSKLSFFALNVIFVLLVHRVSFIVFKAQS